MKGNYLDNIFPPNKIDPQVAPRSSYERNITDKKIINALQKITIEAPEVNTLVPECSENFLQDFYGKGGDHIVWGTWYVSRNNYYPKDNSIFREFMYSLHNCNKWSKLGIVNFLFLQCDAQPSVKKLIAELENQKNVISFCIFLALKQQTISTINIETLAKLYEKTYDIYINGIQISSVYPYGYKEKQAYTLTDLYDKVIFKIKFYQLCGTYVYCNPSNISLVVVDDAFENYLIKYLYDKKCISLPRKDINNNFFRRASTHHIDAKSFLIGLLENVEHVKNKI